MKVAFSLEFDPAPRAVRPARAGIEEVAAARARRKELETMPGPALEMSVACTAAPRDGDGMQEWAVAAADGELMSFGHVKFFGSHHTLAVAINSAVKEALAIAPRGQVPRLTIRTHDRGFGPVNRLGTDGDNGRGGKTRKVAERALRAGVLLTVLWVPDEERLPADTKRDAWSFYDAEARAAACKAHELERAAEPSARATRAGADLPL